MGRATRLLRSATLTAMLAACSDPTEPKPVQNNLVFTRSDQSTISFTDDALLYAWCGAWEDGVVEAPSLQVLVSGPSAEDPGWHLRAVLADVEIGEPLEFPNSFIFEEPKDVDIFVFDPPNELSTQDDRSSGSITFQSLPCEVGAAVRFSIDATIGSEFGDGPPLLVTGTFRVPIGEPPGVERP